MNHTPGPWEVDLETYGRVFGPDGFVLASLEVQDGYEETKANTYLVAAAPEMLSVLERLLKLNREGKVMARVWGDAEAVVAKATEQ